jgi:DNA-directed RNA polymerase beta subunit
MTIGHILEQCVGTLCAVKGQFADATAFLSMTVEDVQRALEAEGIDKDCLFRVFDGRTGEICENPIYCGMIYVQRLKQMAWEKMHSRGAFGPVHIVSRQPTEGRARDGGLRVGEMERDDIVAYGAAATLLDRLMYASDAHLTHVCAKCGLLASPAHPSKTVKRRGPFCLNCHSDQFVKEIMMPFAATLNLKEMMAAGIAPRLGIDLNSSTSSSGDNEKIAPGYWVDHQTEHIAINRKKSRYN